MTVALEPWTPRAGAAVLDEVESACAAAGLPVERSRPLARQTTLGVGGAAGLYVECADTDAVVALARCLGAAPLFVLGKGSNTLVGDGGIDAVVVKLGAGHKWFLADRDVVSAGGGAAMPALAAWAAGSGFAGLEFAAGIPATVGGSVRMNAGAHGGEVANRLVSVDVVLTGSGEMVTLGPDELGFGYRRSVLPPRSVVVAARWRLEPDDPTAIRGRLDELRAWRRRTQPLRERTCGSVFVNPPGDSAGRLVEAAGLKGFAVGGAQVSDKHANFVAARPGARAGDVRDLVEAVRARVLELSGVLLEPEVRLVGTFD